MFKNNYKHLIKEFTDKHKMEEYKLEDSNEEKDKKQKQKPKRGRPKKYTGVKEDIQIPENELYFEN
jgi:FtsZ-interacting cell division protein YlmF